MGRLRTPTTGVVAQMLLLAAVAPLAFCQDILITDRMSGSYFTPNRTFWLTGCTYFASPFTPTTTGAAKWLVLSLSEGPTYSRVRALGIGIYADNGNKPAATLLYSGYYQTNTLLNSPLQMNAATSTWELPIFAYDISNITKTGAGRRAASGRRAA